MSIGIAIGVSLGVPIGLSLGMIAIGPMIGITIGIGIGTYMEKKHNQNPLPISTENEKKNEKAILALLGIFLIVLLVFVALMKSQII
ncbi:hypothetical protein [uncultured Methanomethylovorans sp.]|uniref:hypothetical protein n=1 Tax=uncultured Methanomethylovorans sp. TaxID=183759 RepID=UPI002AA94899|nr:hypothetical protein [uncultured Methanomethylovorans sp.]